MYRLTIHLKNVAKTAVNTGKYIKDSKGNRIPETRKKLVNTISSKHKTKAEVDRELGNFMKENKKHYKSHYVSNVV